jgi:hypothetical protein
METVLAENVKTSLAGGEDTDTSPQERVMQVRILPRESYPCGLTEGHLMFRCCLFPGQ